MKNLPSETFIHELRSALNHLYDPDYLRASPLAVILKVDRRFDTPSALQGILTRAIEALKPAPTAANKIYARSIYDLLLFRYVQQFNQTEIANQLGISVRHLRRQQNLAVYELAGKLWEQYQLGSPNPDEAVQAAVDKSSPAVPDQFTQELVWLKHPSGRVATDLALSLEAVHLLIQPFAEQKNARLMFPTLSAGLAQVHPVAFQQIILTLLTYAIQCAPGEEVLVEAHENQGWQALVLSARLSNPPDGTDQGSLETVKKMVELSEGTFSIESSGKTFRAQVAFRSVIPITVLVIDDNPEIITMMQRFAAETRYQVVGLNDPSVAVEFALKMKPAIIVIDIMMPQVDGLQVLSRFKHHPALGKLPVIICSVLPQKDLAASLGAADFIQKPIQRELFITAIEKASIPS